MRGARTAVDPDALYQIKRNQRDAARRKHQVPEILRGTLLDPNGERNIADDVKAEGLRRAAAARRLSPIGWFGSCLAAAGFAAVAAYGVLYAARMGLLPDLGLMAVPGLTDPSNPYGGIGRSTFYGLAGVTALMQLYVLRQFARRMFSAGPGAAIGVGLYLGAWAIAALVYQAASFDLGAAALTLCGAALFLYGLVPGQNR